MTKLPIYNDLEEQNPITEEQKKKLKEWYSKCIINLNPIAPHKDKPVYYTKGIVDFILQDQPWWKRKYFKWKSKRSFRKYMRKLKTQPVGYTQEYMKDPSKQETAYTVEIGEISGNKFYMLKCHISGKYAFFGSWFIETFGKKEI